MVSTARIPMVGFVAYSGTGKTTLLLKIIPLLKAKGLRLGMIKHSHHGFEIDIPGKDSYRLRQAGADQTLIASRKRWALVVEMGDESGEADLDQVLPSLNQDKLDLILVEGFKHERFPKIEVHRPSLGHDFMFPEDDSIIAIACDAALPQSIHLPVLDMNKPEEIVEFIEKKILRYSDRNR
jgi:molybdopterin-guanine dinucleotide biosynthesis protein MobB